MLNKKRKKVTRMKGSHTHSRGFKKKARGSGHRGGVGMSGTGKRADHKKTLVTKKYGHKYFGKDKRLGKRTQVNSISLKTILEKLNKFAKENKGVYEINLKKHKIIGDSEVNVKLKIDAKAASKGAKEAVKKAGGEIIIAPGKKKVEVKINKEE